MNILDLYELHGRPGTYMAGVVPLSASDGKAPSQVQIGYTDRFEGHRSGPFALTKQTFDDFIAAHAARGTDPAFDIEHESLYDPRAPAQGWVKKLSYREIGNADGKPMIGLFADAEWSDLGEANVANKRYRYLSMLFAKKRIDSKSGKSISQPWLHSVALCKDPFIEQMQPLSLSATFPGRGRADGGSIMDQVRSYLCSTLGLNAAAADEEILAALRKREGDIKLAFTRGAGVVLSAKTLEALGLGLSANAVDGANVDEAVTRLGAELAKLHGEKIAREVDALIEAKRATPAEREDLIELATKDYAFFSKSTSKRTAIAAAAPVVKTVASPSGSDKAAKQQKALDAYCAANKEATFTQALIACQKADPELFNDKVEG